MFGLKKLFKLFEAHLKVVTKEQVTRTDLLMTQNELLVKQVEYTRQLSVYTRRIDEFNRMAYQGSSGVQIPENMQDEDGMRELQENQEGERGAFDDVYHSDISLGLPDA